MSSTGTSGLDERSERTWQRVIYAVSAVVCVAVAFLILGPRPAGVAGAIDVSMLPWVNAGLNTLTTLALVGGYVAIKMRRVQVHKAFMTTAMGFSVVFLLVYITYHWFSTGPAVYEGAYRPFYLVMLITHVVLAAVILPFILTTWFRGWLGLIAKHKAISPYTLGAWLYVTVTGVAIVYMAHG